jgi:alkanesulfonate monooxygenase SsuD/methylene tetrahydromethanopterin reductase-like flavin-dependent oxidoreductase (luciferase family)
VKHRGELDKALVAEGRDPETVGVFWDVVLIVEESEHEARRRYEQLLTGVPAEGIGAFLSHQSGYDLSRLPERFTIEEINAQITASNASPVGFLNITRALDHPPATPRDLLNVVDFLVPELQRRGRFRTEYTGRTLKENLLA